MSHNSMCFLSIIFDFIVVHGLHTSILSLLSFVAVLAFFGELFVLLHGLRRSHIRFPLYPCLIIRFAIASTYFTLCLSSFPYFRCRFSVLLVASETVAILCPFTCGHDTSLYHRFLLMPRFM